MKQQKRHLTVMSIIIALTLTVLCYGGQTGNWNGFVADSHGDKYLYLCSHGRRADSGTSRAARVRVGAKGHSGGGSLKLWGGQIG
jgi:hypothetical protein